MKIISILPDLQGQVGHILDYHMSLKRAVEKNQIIHLAWAPKECGLTLPPLWEKILHIPRKKGLWHQFSSFFMRVRIYFSALKKISDLKETVLFLEHFRITDLAELFLALLFFRQSPQIWLLHRYSPSQMKCRGKLHALLYRYCGRKKELKFFTDSDLLAKQQQLLFNRPVSVLPIPHGHVTTDLKFERDPHLIYCWWPGGATRAAKGLSHIVRISELLHKTSSPIRLIVARNALEKGVVLSPSLISIEDELDRMTYDRWMNTIDIALLPYDPAVYHSATSGIFVEAICSGKIPLIHRDTWMEHEAKKHGLDALVIAWDSPSIIQQIETIHQDERIRKKIEAMKRAYNSFHSEENFSKKLEKTNSGLKARD